MESDTLCVQSVQQYLCYYYYPLCDPTNGDIISVCGDSCNSLFASETVCYDLLMRASEEIRLNSIPVPDNSCSRTHRIFTDPPAVSNNCAKIEG